MKNRSKGQPAIHDETPDNQILKGYCWECSYYHDCPRMRGINDCYNTRDRGLPSSSNGETDSGYEKREERFDSSS